MSFEILIGGIVLFWILIWYAPGLLVAAALLVGGWIAWLSYQDDEGGPHEP